MNNGNVLYDILYDFDAFVEEIEQLKIDKRDTFDEILNRVIQGCLDQRLTRHAKYAFKQVVNPDIGFDRVLTDSIRFDSTGTLFRLLVERYKLIPTEICVRESINQVNYEVFNYLCKKYPELFTKVHMCTTIDNSYFYMARKIYNIIGYLPKELYSSFYNKLTQTIYSGHSTIRSRQFNGLCKFLDSIGFRPDMFIPDIKVEFDIDSKSTPDFIYGNLFIKFPREPLSGEECSVYCITGKHLLGPEIPLEKVCKVINMLDSSNMKFDCDFDINGTECEVFIRKGLVVEIRAPQVDPAIFERFKRSLEVGIHGLVETTCGLKGLRQVVSMLPSTLRKHEGFNIMLQPPKLSAIIQKKLKDHGAFK